MSNDITFMDCWGFIAPLLPVSTDFERGVYVMVFHALMKEAEKRRIAEKKRGEKMKITLDIPDSIVCCYVNGVSVTSSQLYMVSYALDHCDLHDGAVIKLPREEK